MATTGSGHLPVMTDRVLALFAPALTPEGAVLLDALLALIGAGDPRLEGLTLAAIGLGWIWKRATWRHNDRLAVAATANSATGLAGGAVRSIEWPHTQENYVLKEMGYRVARKHAAKLRLIAELFAFAIPFAATAAERPKILKSRMPASSWLRKLPAGGQA